MKPTTGRCFAAGTPVATPDGLRPIETLRAGDRVLTGDGPVGPARLGSILAIHRSRSDRTLSLAIDGETIVATEGHPLWKHGRGWTPAGELRTGDELATTGGWSVVKAVEIREGGEVWNLEVLDGETFIVGRAGLIAHDLGPIAEPFWRRDGGPMIKSDASGK